MSRFERSDILYGKSLRESFADKVFAVAGLGAVGSFAVEMLARFWVVNFVLIDCDVIEESNINRQLFALESTISKDKCQVAKERVLDINPNANVKSIKSFIDANNCKELFIDNKVSIIIDAIDCIASKCEMAQFALQNNIAFVSSMGAARRTDSGKVSVGKFWNVKGCVLASKMRKILRQKNFYNDFKCVYSDEQILQSSHLVSSKEGQKKVIGSSPFVTSIFGIKLAELAIKELGKLS